ATVSGPGATPTGTVTFKEGSVVLAADVPLVNGSASYTVTAPSTGSHDYTAEYSGQPGFYSAASGSATVNVAKADPAYTAPTNLAATYGDTLASVTLPSGWTWDDVGLVGQVGDQAHTATYTPSDTANYNTVSGISLTVTVQPLAITVTANDQHKYVGAPDPALTYTVNPPLIGSDTLAGSLKYTGSDVGTYDIVQDAPFSNSNYTITFVKGTMTISSASSVQDVIQKILSLPNPVVTWADADKVAAATNAYNALSSSDKAQIPQDVLAKLTTAQSQSGPVNRTDTTNGGAVSGANLPWYIRIEITPIPQADSRFSGVGGQAPGKSLLALYDIKLVNTLTSATYQLPAGTSVTVELDKVPLSGATGIAVVHEKADGTLETINATVSGTKLTFTASSFSLYGVTAAPAAPAAAPSGQMYVSTGGSIANQSDVTIWLVLITLIGAAYLLRRSVKATSKDSYITIMMMD
ncbi:MAG: Ig-like domain repeat protein, partial [Propionibacteriaceae bacterium]|nr:Ig-like domain repeat protein [Propionibacteriaceae bacterium]